MSDNSQDASSEFSDTGTQTAANGYKRKTNCEPKVAGIAAVFDVTRNRVGGKRGLLYLRSPDGKILAANIGSEIQSWLFYQSAWIARRDPTVFLRYFFMLFVFSGQKIAYSRRSVVTFRVKRNVKDPSDN